MPKGFLIAASVAAFAGFAITTPFPASAYAAIMSGMICGHVSDPYSRLIPNARLELRGQNGSRTTRTDGEGQYCFDGVSGAFSLTASAPGFRATTFAVEVADGEQAQANFVLDTGSAGG